MRCLRFGSWVLGLGSGLGSGLGLGLGLSLDLGLRFGLRDLGFAVWVLGWRFGVCGLSLAFGFYVVDVFRYRVQGLRFRVYVEGFKSVRATKKKLCIPLYGLRVEQECRCKATWKREFKLSWREVCLFNHDDDVVGLDQ